MSFHGKKVMLNLFIMHFPMEALGVIGSSGPLGVCAVDTSVLIAIAISVTISLFQP